MFGLNLVNRWARLSCDKWNKVALLRRFYRALYRHAARKDWESPRARQKTQQYQDVYYYFDTYPWPYNDPNFANWEEDDTIGNYTLVTDQSNFVIKHCTSYCAWKIFEFTGHWPRRKTHRRFDAKLWQEFLTEAGYETIITEPQSGHRYVGVEEHSQSEFGEVVWFEKTCDPNKEGRTGVLVSTYRHKKYFCGPVNPQKYLWIQII